MEKDIHNAIHDNNDLIYNLLFRLVFLLYYSKSVYENNRKTSYFKIFPF